MRFKMNEASSRYLNMKHIDLLHIVKTSSFCYCLICMEDVRVKSEINHVKSQNHQDNVKFLFKLCIRVPDVLLSSNTENCLDILKTSVLDASALLGKETCYISEQGGEWNCLLRKKKILSFNCDQDVLKKSIDKHIQSANHLLGIRHLSFLYRFPYDNNNFICLQKSAVFCSFCKETYRCTKDSTFETALSHLLNFNHLKQFNIEGAGKLSVTTVVQPSEDLAMEINTIKVDSNPSNSVRSDARNNSCVMLSKVDRYICHLCKSSIEVIDADIVGSIHNHCKDFHQNRYKALVPVLIKNVICFNKKFLKPRKLCKKHPEIKQMAKLDSVFEKQCHFIQIFDKVCFCSLCAILISYAQDPITLMNNFVSHFHGQYHKATISGCQDCAMKNFQNNLKHKKAKFVSCIHKNIKYKFKKAK